VLVEASARKAAFLRELAEIPGLPEASVVERQVQGPRDLESWSPIAVLAVRAVGGWARLLPKLVPLLGSQGRVLVWAGEVVDRVRGRAAWRRLRLIERHPLPARSHSWIWAFAPASSGEVEQE
jgi:16S rRNA G527 N7-methylase RsmG